MQLMRAKAAQAWLAFACGFARRTSDYCKFNNVHATCNFEHKRVVCSQEGNDYTLSDEGMLIKASSLPSADK